MERGSPDGFALPNDVLIVEDDPIIALDFEDTILGFGVTAVRTASSVARALDMIAERAPDRRHCSRHRFAACEMHMKHPELCPLLEYPRPGFGGQFLSTGFEFQRVGAIDAV